MAGSFERKADTEIIGRAGGMEVRAPRSQPAPETEHASPAAPARDDAPPRRRSARRFVVESSVAIAMTIACLIIFILFLNLSFPEGHDLRELLRSRSSTGLLSREGWRGGDSTASLGNPIATLSVLHAAVRSKSAGSIAWTAAPAGIGLRAGDGIQTGASGTAQLDFDHGEVRLEENSLVILGGGAGVSDLLSQTPRSLTVVRGELFAKIDRESPGEMTIVLPRGIARLRPGAPAPAHSEEGGDSTLAPPGTTDPGAEAVTGAGSPAAFRIVASEDRSSAITVLSGSLALEAGGKSVSVGPGEYSRIDQEGAPSDPLPAPEPPEPVTPTSGSRFAYLDLPPLVPFRWRSSSGEDQYRFRVKRGPEFTYELVSVATSDTSLDWGRLGPGEYEWQVSRVVDGVEGMPSAPRRLLVEPRGGPIALTVDPLPRRASNPRLTVRGQARPGAQVYVLGQPASVRPDGTFSTQVSLPPGASIVLVEAVDEAGYSVYSSQVVYVEN